jgi:hypothetical protein
MAASISGYPHRHDAWRNNLPLRAYFGSAPLSRRLPCKGRAARSSLSISFQSIPMLQWRSILLATLLFAGCSHNGGVAPDPAVGSTQILYGTYFGHCAGYCVATMTIDQSSVVLKRSSVNGIKFPEKEDRRATTSAEWSQLYSLANLDAMMALDSVIGCPDCDDSGGEWIEVRRGEKTKRVVFEYGETIPTIGDLVARARAVRATFKD